MAITPTAINRYPTKAAIYPDPDTAAKGNEGDRNPRMRSKLGRQDGSGVNLVPDTQGGTVSVGDEAEALSAIDPGEEPLR